MYILSIQRSSVCREVLKCILALRHKELSRNACNERLSSDLQQQGLSLHNAWLQHAKVAPSCYGLSRHEQTQLNLPAHSLHLQQCYWADATETLWNCIPYPSAYWPSCLSFRVLAIHIKMSVSPIVALCSLIEVCPRFGSACCLHHQGDDDGRSPDNWSSKHFRNVGKLSSDYTAHQPRRQPSSHSLLWEPDISLTDNTERIGITTGLNR
jgi:hypothetical protein